jgi:hypothetical protein
MKIKTVIEITEIRRIRRIMIKIIILIILILIIINAGRLNQQIKSRLESQERDFS